MFKLISGILMMVMAFTSYGQEKDAFSGSKFFYFDKADRVEILTDLYKQTKAEYALWEIKKRRISVDGDEVFKSSIERELSIEDFSDSLDQAKSNLDFIDRVKETIAKFQDTHFAIRTVVTPPWIVSGLSTKKVGDFIVVSGIYDKVLSKTSVFTGNSKVLNAISIGDVILEVNGVPATKAAKEYEKFVAGSSSGFIQNEAAGYLLERYFSYPDKPYVDIKIFVNKYKQAVDIRLPYYYSEKTNRRDAKFYFSQKGFLKLQDLRFKWNEKQRMWESDSSLKYRGYRAAGLPQGAIELSNWKSSAQGGSTIVRSAIVLENAKAYGFLQINSFSVTNLFSEGKTEKFIPAIRQAVKYFKEQNLDIILDLRNNGGGNGNYPEQVLSLLTEADKVYANTTWAKRVTRYTRQFIDFYNNDELFHEISNQEFWQEMIDQIFISIDEKKNHTHSITEGVVSADPYVGGFSNKVVALISPSCISACDIMSMLLQSSKRATIIGTTSNGTGAGYWSNSNLSTNFQDRYHVVSTNIPNTLFGYPGEVNQVDLGEDSAYLFNSENRPVVAEIQYQDTLEDIIFDSRGWIKKAIEILK